MFVIYFNSVYRSTLWNCDLLQSCCVFGWVSAFGILCTFIWNIRKAIYRMGNAWMNLKSNIRVGVILVEYICLDTKQVLCMRSDLMAPWFVSCRNSVEASGSTCVNSNCKVIINTCNEQQRVFATTFLCLLLLSYYIYYIRYCILFPNSVYNIVCAKCRTVGIAKL